MGCIIKIAFLLNELLKILEKDIFGHCLKAVAHRIVQLTIRFPNYLVCHKGFSQIIFFIFDTIPQCFQIDIYLSDSKSSGLPLTLPQSGVRFSRKACIDSRISGPPK
jgi:hypothetical protein